MADYLGGESIAGGKMKSVGTIEEKNGLWLSPNDGATNESGFTVLPNGRRNGAYPSAYESLGDHGSFWTSTVEDNDPYTGKSLGFSWNNPYSSHENTNILKGLGIRCLKD